MSKLAIVIPSRDEKFLTPTIDDIFRNVKGEVEVIAVLDSNLWPADWKEVTARHGNRLHTIHHGHPKGLRASINSGVASAVSRGAKYIAKFDGHCSFSEGFDEVLKAECEPNWIVVPRRGRLDPENWCETELHKPPIDYHYLSFPDDPNDFGGKGLNGKPWPERAIERKDILLDEEMSSQGSGWFMHADYFSQLELMDEANYGGFWNEFQEIGLKSWLSGGQVMVNKKCKYLHLHKGTKYGRGYKLQESWLKQGAGFTKNWIWNDAWPKQTLPFKWLIEHFWPVPGWPESWEEILYATRKPRAIAVDVDTVPHAVDVLVVPNPTGGSQLRIHKAHYGVGGLDDIDVREHLQNLAFLNKDCLDIVVNNSTLTPGQNPFRGKKKQLNITYSFNNGEVITRTVAEKDWLIIGSTPLVGIDYAKHGQSFTGLTSGQRDKVYEDANEFIDKVKAMRQEQENTVVVGVESGAPVFMETKDNDWQEIGKFGGIAPMTAAALNDYLVRKFQISDRRLRGPMPIELRDFHRNDLAKLFAELGFTTGVEVGVAEGHYSEILCKAIPNLELLCVDPWQRYKGNPWAHSQEHQDFSLNETKRKLAGYNAKLIQDFSMNAVRDVAEESLDFAYIDGHHGFDWVMEDLIAWGRKVRSGGIISGDDYYHFKRHWAGVVEAVNAYTQAHQATPWFLIDAPRSVDFFFVKP